MKRAYGNFGAAIKWEIFWFLGFNGYIRIPYTETAYPRES